MMKTLYSKKILAFVILETYQKLRANQPGGFRRSFLVLRTNNFLRFLRQIRREILNLVSILGKLIKNSTWWLFASLQILIAFLFFHHNLSLQKLKFYIWKLCLNFTKFLSLVLSTRKDLRNPPGWFALSFWYVSRITNARIFLNRVSGKSHTNAQPKNSF